MDDSAFRRGIEGYLSAQLDTVVTVVGLRRPTATGFSAETVLVDVRIDGPTGAEVANLVVQAAPTGPALFDDYDLARTFRVQRDLADFAVPVARMRWLCHDPTWLGTPFYVMDHVAGRVPPDRPPYHTGGWLHDAPAGDRERVWASGLAAMAALHAVPTDGFDFLDDDLGHPSGGTDPASQRIERWRRFGHEQGPDAEPVLFTALDRLDRSRPRPGTLGERRVHWGDAKLGNMIFDGSDVAAILDWELCGLGVGEEDLAHWMAVDWLLSTGLGHRRLDGLPDADATIGHYERAAGRATISVDWWFAFALVRMGLIFQRAAIQSRRRRGGEGELRPNVIAAHLDPILDGTAWARYQRG